MIEQMKSMAIFAAVVEAQSFRGAAKKLSLSPSVVSLHVKKLEQQIGVPLLYRSTRQVTLTQDGETLYNAATAMVSSARDGLDSFANRANTHLTDLRIAMPNTITKNPIFERIAKFARLHSGVRINLMSTDKKQNLIGEGHDVAVRMGVFENSDLKSKRIGEDRRILVCSPEYFSQLPQAMIPEDLSHSKFIGFSVVPDGIRLERKGIRTDRLWGDVIAKSSSVDAVRSLCVFGLGISALPYHEVANDIASGRLQRVLPEWEDITVLPIYLVWPKNAAIGVATREFIDFMSEK